MGGIGLGPPHLMVATHSETYYSAQPHMYIPSIVPTIWEGVLRVCVLHVCGWVLINPPDDTITWFWDPGRACLHWETVEMWTEPLWLLVGPQNKEEATRLIKYHPMFTNSATAIPPPTDSM